MERGYAIGLVISATSLLDGSNLLAQERTLPAPPAGVQTSREYGVDFVTVNPTSAANAPFPVPPQQSPNGSNPGYFNRPTGSVPYAFRMARTEVTTGQYLAFANLAWQMNPQNRYAIEPTFWGARLVEDSPTHMRWELDPNIPNAADVPVNGMSWVQAAWFCNYLHNGGQNDLSTLTHGAYDTSTFTGDAGQVFNHQLTRSPGARYWIPSLDEWVMAGFYDPNRNGSGLGGYWNYGTSSDSAPVYGAPGTLGAESNSGWEGPGFAEHFVPVASYGAQSPWGLFDVAGGASELTEAVWPDASAPIYRRSMGSEAGLLPGVAASADTLGRIYAGTFNETAAWGLRIASVVPSPSTLASVPPLLLFVFVRRRP